MMGYDGHEWDDHDNDDLIVPGKAWGKTLTIPERQAIVARWGPYQAIIRWDVQRFDHIMFCVRCREFWRTSPRRLSNQRAACACTRFPRLTDPVELDGDAKQRVRACQKRLDKAKADCRKKHRQEKRRRSNPWAVRPEIRFGRIVVTYDILDDGTVIERRKKSR